MSNGAHTDQAVRVGVFVSGGGTSPEVGWGAGGEGEHMKEFAVFWGCTIPARFPFIEKSTRVVFEDLGPPCTSLPVTRAA